MKKKGFIILIIMLLLTVSTAFLGCDDGTPPPTPTYRVVYTAPANGMISGNRVQSVQSGNDATPVAAMPYFGYKFVKWSDTESTEPTRTDTNITADINAIAEFEKKVYSVTYNAGEGGTIEGVLEQTIIYNENAATIIAIPNIGYRFVEWSDTNDNQTERTDTKVSGDINATAIFEKIINNYTYVYNNSTDFYAEQNNTVDSITIAYESLSETSFVVPIREYFTFDGWYLEDDFTTQVTNGQGKLVIDHKLFDSESRVLHAKWTVNEETTYKILLVFVTEAEATLYSSNKTPWIYDDDKYVSFHYVMSAIERQICELLAIQFQKHINKIFDGLVIFEVDTYFTTEKLGTEHFGAGNNSGLISHHLDAYDIPEVSHLLDDYRTVMTTFGMNDYDNLLHSVGGSASWKYAIMHIESIFSGLVVNNVPFEVYLDEDYIGWVSTMDHYTHEFIHTVEIAFGTYSYHDSCGHYSNNLGINSNEKQNALYLLNQMVINDERVGIPYSAWQGNLPMKFYNDRQDIDKQNVDPYIVTIKYGSTIAELLAEVDYIPVREGYKFMGWYHWGYPPPLDRKLIIKDSFYAVWEKE